MMRSLYDHGSVDGAATSFDSDYSMDAEVPGGAWTVARAPAESGVIERVLPSLAARAYERLSASELTASKETASAATLENTDGGLDSARTKTLVLPQPFHVNPGRRLRSSTFYALQEWEGYIVDVRDIDIVVRLVDLTAGGTAVTDEATIPLDEISDEDRDKIRPGRLFRWAIGFNRSPTGTKERVSRIVFRQMPAWSKAEIKAAKEEAAELSEYFAATLNSDRAAASD